MKRGTKRKAAARSAALKKAGKRAAAKRRASGKNTALLASGAIARATARAQASMRTELGRKPGLAERMTEAALNEAEEIGMLLDESEESAEDDEDSSGEADYFLKLFFISWCFLLID